MGALGRWLANRLIFKASLRPLSHARCSRCHQRQSTHRQIVDAFSILIDFFALGLWYLATCTHYTLTLIARNLVWVHPLHKWLNYAHFRHSKYYTENQYFVIDGDERRFVICTCLVVKCFMARQFYLALCFVIKLSAVSQCMRITISFQ